MSIITDSDGNRCLRVRGFTIKLQADLLSFSSFLLSLLAIGFSAIQLWQGAQIRMFAPEQITLWADKNGWVHLLAEVPFTNTAAPGNDAILSRQKVTFDITDEDGKSRTICFVWQNRVHSSLDTDQRLTFTQEVNASRVPLPGGGVVSFEHTYFPRHRSDGPTYADFVNKDEFASFLARVEVITFKFTAEFQGRRALFLPVGSMEKTVTIRVDDAFRQHFTNRSTSTTSTIENS